MDLKLVSVNNTWDIDVVDGVPVVLENEEEIKQRAHIAAYLIPNTIPALPDVGNPWPEFLLNKISLSELDSVLRQTINTMTNSAGYFPTYEEDEENGVKVVITKLYVNGET